MVKYRDKDGYEDSEQRAMHIRPRGRGSIMQDSLRAGRKVAKEFMAEVREMQAARPKPRGDTTDALFNALGLPMRRAMVRRLREGGAMSLSKLAEPYKISLPAALKHVRTLEENGIISSEKHGRVRICVYNPLAFKELADKLASGAAFWKSNFAHIEKNGSKKKRKG